MVRDQTDIVNSVAAQFPGDPETALIVQRDHAWVVGHSWAISSSLTNDARVGISRSNLDFPTPFRPTEPNQFSFGGLSAPFAGIDEQSRVVDTPTIRDDATWSWNNHTFLFGAQFKPIRSRSGIRNDFNNPTIGIGGNLVSLSSGFRPPDILLDAATYARGAYDRAFTTLLGRYASISTTFNYDINSQPLPLASGKTRDYRYNEYEFYVQDNWKARSDLTLNFGVRYQFYPPPYEANGFQAHNDMDFRELYERRVRNAAAGIGGAAAEPLLRYDLIGPENGKRDIYSVITNLASSEYHGMLVSLQKGFSNGLQFDLNYTWSHAIDNQSSITNTVFGGLLCDLNDLTAGRLISTFAILSTRTSFMSFRSARAKCSERMSRDGLIRSSAVGA